MVSFVLPFTPYHEVSVGVLILLSFNSVLFVGMNSDRYYYYYY